MIYNDGTSELHIRLHIAEMLKNKVKRCTHFEQINMNVNEELAGILGVSQRTLIRKARELGLEKNSQWLL